MNSSTKPGPAPSPEKAPAPAGGMTGAEIADALRHSMTTASNDDTTRPGTVERERHCQRLDAMEEAISFIIDRSQPSAPTADTGSGEGWRKITADDIAVLARIGRYHEERDGSGAVLLKIAGLLKDGGAA